MDHLSDYATLTDEQKEIHDLSSSAPKQQPAVPAPPDQELKAELMFALAVTGFNGNLVGKASETAERYLAADKHLVLPSALADITLAEAVAKEIKAINKSDAEPQEKVQQFTSLAVKHGTYVDPRDYGKFELLRTSVNCADLASISLKCKLHFSTIMSIAALNLDRMHGDYLCALARGFGTAYGMLRIAKDVTEHMFSAAHPDPDKFRSVIQYFKRDPATNMSRALHLLCSYGIVHVRMGHTYRGNAELRSWYYERLMTLLTGCQLSIDMSTVSEDQKEVYCRTACHCFGDVNCMGLYLYMFHNNLMEKNFRLRWPMFNHEVSSIQLAHSALLQFRSMRWWPFFAQAFASNIAHIMKVYGQISKDPLRYCDRSSAYVGLPKIELSDYDFRIADSILIYLAGYLDSIEQETTYQHSYALGRVSRENPGIVAEFCALLTQDRERMAKSGIKDYLTSVVTRRVTNDSGASLSSTAIVAAKASAPVSAAPAPQVDARATLESKDEGGGDAAAADAAAAV